VFYDREVTPRYMNLKIIGEPSVVATARTLRRSLNDVRHLIVDGEEIPNATSEQFRRAHQEYRQNRDSFISSARADLASR
jgi:hypothetical protein